MKHPLRYALIVAMLAAIPGWPAVATAAIAGLSYENAAVGLKPARTAPPLSGRLGLRADLSESWQAAESGDVVYGGEREALRLGGRSTESFGGVYFPLSQSWGASLETGVLQETALLPRRYSLEGHLHTALSGGGGFSLGLKYRVYDSDLAPRTGIPGDLAGAYGYALVPARLPGASYGPSYQLQLNYHYNAANVFGLAFGREVETFTPGFETAGNGRQFTFTGQHWLTPSWALSYDLLSNDPGALRLQGLRFGVRYRF